jgi:RimJ/RimL family protein N-acetyltransferase
MASFAFETLGAPVLCAICDPDNRNSARVMERLGMRYKGQEVWHEKTVSVWQLAREQWEARQPA